MRLPNVHGMIRRRLLVNFRVDPVVMQKLLPSPFRPKLHSGYAIAGICLISLDNIRPQHVPECFGIKSENAAHRVAVEWDDIGGIRSGVYINRRDTGSVLNRFAGGRLFPGEHHRAMFRVEDDGMKVALQMASADGNTQIDIAGRSAEELPHSSIFRSIGQASTFFESGSLGYSPTRGGNHFDGLSLQTKFWTVAPFKVDHLLSSYFADRTRFPEGSIDFDCALVMRNIPHVWSSAAELHTLPTPCSQGSC
ncbi:MAG TPA: DUF2071 domain-containing protein [Acidobacteriaceae bacterium]|nr:DUF2071 domain-containing protein [Acidobacteriaceae bacterium]